MSDKPSIVALIPARAGSKRVKAKNICYMGGHPLIAYTVQPAIQSGVFDAVIVSTEDDHTANIARHYGAEIPFMRPEEYAADKSPDIEWIQYTLERLKDEGRNYDCFSILRPTSPFRTADTIQRAWNSFLKHKDAVDSLRAVELCGDHPGKMWCIDDSGTRMSPLLPEGATKSPPWHSTPYQALPKVYIQNASLEIAWTRVPMEHGTIAGDTLLPFVSEGHEGFDINRLEDWMIAEHRLHAGEVELPEVSLPAWK